MRDIGFDMREKWWGHWMTFENGLTISIQFGWGMYCENYDNVLKRPFGDEPHDPNCRSKDAEIAIMYKGDMVTRKFIDCYDDVAGRVGINKVADIIYKLKNWTPGKRVVRINLKEKNETTKN